MLVSQLFLLSLLPFISSQCTNYCPNIRSEVPAALRQSAKLVIYTVKTSSPPISFSNNSGFAIDLVNKIGEILDLKINFVTISSPLIIPTLKQEKFSASVSFVFDTPAAEKQVSFVGYLKGGTSFYVRANSNITINKLTDLCGLAVAVTTGFADLVE
ncbi:unnamed protein product, partial [Didymodactylos carnosus]